MHEKYSIWLKLKEGNKWIKIHVINKWNKKIMNKKNKYK
jgi:hypothetical protein